MERPFAVTGLDHVVLRCRDLDRMLAFYRDVLGLPEERRIDALGLVQLRAGRSLVDLLRDWEADGRGTPNVDHVCLGVARTAIEPVVPAFRSLPVKSSQPRSGVSWAIQAGSSAVSPP